MLGGIEGRRRRVTTEDEMVGWHHRLDGHEFGVWGVSDPGPKRLLPERAPGLLVRGRSLLVLSVRR